jgi:hypothetical protein
LTYHVCPPDEAPTALLADPTVLVVLVVELVAEFVVELVAEFVAELDAAAVRSDGSGLELLDADEAPRVSLADPTVLVVEFDATAVRSDRRELELREVSVTG